MKNFNLLLFFALSTIFVTSCSSKLYLDSTRIDDVSIDGLLTEWNTENFYGISGNNIYASSLYNDSLIFISLRITDDNEIMKVLSNGITLSYKVGKDDFSFKMISPETKKDFNPPFPNDSNKMTRNPMKPDTLSVNMTFVPVNGSYMKNQKMYKGCMKSDGGIFTIETAIPYDSIKENGSVELKAVISGVKNSRPSDMDKPKQGPGDGGQMQPPEKNGSPGGPPPGMNNSEIDDDLSKDNIINIVVKFK